MKRARFSALADSDLQEIVDYIAADNPSAAESLINTVHEKCELLASFPELGPRRPGFSDAQLRSFTIDNYVIFYRPTADGVEIARVLHGARDLESLL